MLSLENWKLKMSKKGYLYWFILIIKLKLLFPTGLAFSIKVLIEIFSLVNDASTDQILFDHCFLAFLVQTFTIW